MIFITLTLQISKIFREGGYDSVSGHATNYEQ